MSPSLLVPILLGAVVVIQANLNRSIAADWSLVGAAATNMAVGLALVMLYLVATTPQGGTQPLASIAPRWWWILPGFFGLLLVLGTPWAIARLGSLPVFVALVGSQVVSSALWDHFVAHVPFSATRIAGALLAIAGVALVGAKP